MKKLVTGSLLAVLALSVATPAFAHGGEGKNGLKLGENFFRLEDRMERRLDRLEEKLGNNFVVKGTITNISGSTLTLKVDHQVNVPNATNGSAAITVNADTKYTGNKHETVTLANLKVGQQIIATGPVSGTTATATRVHLIMKAGKSFGQVTAKTDTSITIKNSVTNETVTITTDADTKVAINGESKTLADVQVGDRGFVKFKTTVSGMIAKVINLFR